MKPRWRLTVLGELQVRSADRVFSRFRTRKAGLLLAYLGLALRGARGPRTVSRAELSELLWPELAPESALDSLSTTLSSLRRLLETPESAGAPVLLADRFSVGLDPGAISTDVAEFEEALHDAARAPTAVERVACLTNAAELYHGDLLPGYHNAWVLWERAALSERFAQALKELVGHLERTGEYDRALSYARQGVTIDPLCEEAHGSLIRLLAATGQRAAALHRYREMERLLRAELGVAPSLETQELGCALRDAEGTQHTPPVGTAPPRPLPTSLQALSSETGQLPLALTRFYGRQGEIDFLLGLLDAGSGPDDRLEPCHPRLITLTGPAGSGKTRLAQEVTRRLKGGGRTVWFVPLADLAESSRLLERVLIALRIPRTEHRDAMEQVVAVLSTQPSLLLLDNVEHLLPEGAAPIRQLLERVPGLTLLVTSRRALEVAGEQVFPVPPLPVPEASETGERLRSYASVQLFEDRSRAVRPDFQVSLRNAETVAELCRRLEGLPLSLELAATRSRVLTPAQMLSRLTRRFELLNREGADLDPRHRSLRAALQWSYRLLPAAEQQFFARLSVFRGGWTLEAAEAVCQEPQALERLSRLSAASMAVAEEQGGAIRYRLLESLREFAAEQLSREEETLLAERHARYFLALAEAAEPMLHTAAQAEWLDRLERELDNFRGALDWAVSVGAADRTAAELGLELGGALGCFWDFRGHWVEGHGRLAQLLALPGIKGGTRAWAKGLTYASQFAISQGDWASARSAAEESLPIWRELGDPAGIAHSCYVLSRVVMRGREYATSSALLEESLRIRRGMEDPWLIAVTLVALGDRDLQKDAAVRSYLEESLALWRAVGDARGIILGLRGVADQCYLEGDFATARHHYEEAAEIARGGGYRGDLPGAVHMLGEVARCERAYTRAAALYGECLPLWPQIGNHGSLAGALLGLGYVALRQGILEEAIPRFADALGIYQELGSVRERVIVLVGLAGVARARGKPERAARLLGAVEALSEDRGIRFWSADRMEHEQEVAAVSAALPAETLAAAWAEGRALALEDAIRYALGDPDA